MSPAMWLRTVGVMLLVVAFYGITKASGVELPVWTAVPTGLGLAALVLGAEAGDAR